MGASSFRALFHWTMILGDGPKIMPIFFLYLFTFYGREQGHLLRPPPALVKWWTPVKRLTRPWNFRVGACSIMFLEQGGLSKTVYTPDSMPLLLGWDTLKRQFHLQECNFPYQDNPQVLQWQPLFFSYSLTRCNAIPKSSGPTFWLQLKRNLLDSQMKMGAMSSRGFTTSRLPSACFFRVGTGIPRWHPWEKTKTSDSWLHVVLWVN